MSNAPRRGVTRLGVAGWPVRHSRSPVMQNAALEAVGLAGSWRYQHLPIPPQLFTEAVRALPASGFRGINVTLPHKSAALALADGASDRASAIGAANTLLFQPDGSIVADNTDAPALAGALSDLLDGGVAGRSALVIGAGGSGRAATWALIDAGAAPVYVWNRTAQRAVELAAQLGAQVAPQPCEADVIVNCTSVGLAAGASLDQLPIGPQLLERAAVIVDFVYGPGLTPFAAAAAAAAVPFVDGLELLVRQGAESFAQFTGLQAPRDVMRAAATHR